MSSSTTLTFIFPEMTTLEVSIGNGIVPAYLGLAENRDITFSDVKALRLMGDSNIVGAMSRFDQSMLNLLIDRHMSHENVRCRDAIDAGTEHFPSTCLYLKVAHHR
ncbi:hypothetical protein pEaSNUABM28_00267 [Erwinia phage pEa_SNUABM_28]|uniref:Uncharacterized protein n=1 Tax=Erwinia phage pEa_SNUABM_16 TaxID=2869544 RepID=A0AAE8XR26_9CAUD|nr:hypothetical protein MPK64_gp265 [Erwinia phage pEa_SNUABM_16]QZE58824.1 hypothetical protein pEaSNUABM28_00267 [Erwinia phage pEa_SNUABM_28]QZE59168.1 hypothetical protein pEaSNUABM18_00265 [Erwinia phage pEa_SNUABM_18]UAW96409.1 hypothetical protein pEaSNUABM16_00265 [Erwinia phage pEa_SNUABM_16]